MDHYEQHGYNPSRRHIYDARGRLAFCRQVDPGGNPEYAGKFSALGSRIGVNDVGYATTR